MGPACMFSRGVETLRIDEYLKLILLTHGNLAAFHRLMKYVDPLSVRKAHPSLETTRVLYYYKCAAGLKTLLVEYLLMQSRHLTGEEKNPKTKEEIREMNEWYASSDRSVRGNAVLSSRHNQRTGRGSDLHLWILRDVCLPKDTCERIPTFSGVRESNHHLG